jgi:hypothetical protein
MAQLLSKAAKTPKTGLKYEPKLGVNGYTSTSAHAILWNTNLWMKDQKARHPNLYRRTTREHMVDATGTSDWFVKTTLAEAKKGRLTVEQEKKAQVLERKAKQLDFLVGTEDEDLIQTSNSRLLHKFPHIVDSSRSIIRELNQRHPPQPVHYDEVLSVLKERDEAIGGAQPAVKIRAFRELLIHAGFSFSQAKPMTVAAETAAALAYQAKYLEGKIGNRKRGFASVEADLELMMSLPKGSPGRPSARRVLQKKGGFTRGEGWEKPEVTLDESYVTLHHVKKKTVHDKKNDEHVNRRDGAGQRVCIGGAVVYFSDPGTDRPHARFLPGKAGFFMFRANGGKTGAKGTAMAGPKAADVKAAIRELDASASVSGTKPKLFQKFIDLSTTATRALTAAEEDMKESITHALGLLESVEDMNPGHTDNFDYHGNFDSARFTKWFRHLCATLKEHYGSSEINMDGATYHKLRLNPTPTTQTNRPDMIKWLEERGHELGRDLITAEQKITWKPGGTGLNLNDLYTIAKANFPEPQYEVYTIAREFGHTVRFTPPYCHRSAPIEIIWANIKNPIGDEQGVKTIPDLMKKLQEKKDPLKDPTMLGAYADARQWEDEMYLALQDQIGAEGDMPIEPDDIPSSDSDDYEDEGDDDVDEE